MASLRSQSDLVAGGQDPCFLYGLQGDSDGDGEGTLRAADLCCPQVSQPPQKGGSPRTHSPPSHPGSLGLCSANGASTLEGSQRQQGVAGGPSHCRRLASQKQNLERGGSHARPRPLAPARPTLSPGVS